MVAPKRLVQIGVDGNGFARGLDSKMVNKFTTDLCWGEWKSRVCFNRHLSRGLVWTNHGCVSTDICRGAWRGPITGAFQPTSVEGLGVDQSRVCFNRHLSRGLAWTTAWFMRGQPSCHKLAGQMCTHGVYARSVRTECTHRVYA